MKLREVMTNPVIRIHPDESVAVAARTLTRYNIGALPVCGGDGRMCGLITDRDIVTRCLAAGRPPGATTVRLHASEASTSPSRSREASTPR